MKRRTMILDAKTNECRGYFGTDQKEVSRMLNLLAGNAVVKRETEKGGVCTTNMVYVDF